MTEMTASPKERISVLRNSHDRLDTVLNGLEPSQLTGPSYCSDWTIAQVLSHLGSGAEIFSLITEAVVNDTEPPGREMFPSIWDAWNAKEPAQQAADYKGADEALLEQLESIDEERLAALKISMFGMDLDAATFVTMRLSEHSLHGWDIAVSLDPTLRLAPEAAAILVDSFAQRAPMAAKPTGESLRVLIETTDPKRTFLLSVDEKATVEEDPDSNSRQGAGSLAIPSEALVRLVAGRLDADHTPTEVRADGVVLDQLRAVFPGF
jgi:uncharacterized protein (TIGR03083 family)